MKLSEALQQSRRDGALSEEAARISLDIARSYMTKLQKSRGWPWAVIDDGMGAFVDKLMKKWPDIDPSVNPRSYMMRMASSTVYDQLRKYDAVRRRDEKVAKIPQKTATVTMSTETLLQRAGVKNGSCLSLPLRRELRAEGVRLLDAGVMTMQIVRALGVSRVTVWRWKQMRGV